MAWPSGYATKSCMGYILSLLNIYGSRLQHGWHHIRFSTYAGAYVEKSVAAHAPQQESHLGALSGRIGVSARAEQLGNHI